MRATMYPLEERFVARVRGAAALTFLHDSTSQDLSGLSAGSGALTCLLDEKGRVLSELRALVLGDGTVLLDGEPAAREHVMGWLARVAPLSGCEVVEESWGAVAVRGPEAAAALGIAPDLPEHAFVERDGSLIVRVSWGDPGFDVLGPAPSLDLAAGNQAELEGARIAAGRPRFGVDVTPELHIAETPLLARAVSFTKGCYPGQESVARVVNLGRPRRALVALLLDSPRAPSPGTAVVLDGTELGRVTSGASGPDAGVALALVRAETPDGAVVAVDGTSATVCALG